MRLPPINRQKLDQLSRLTAAQLAGDSAARQTLQRLEPKLEESYCLWNLYAEWYDAFSYEPGRLEALPLIASLAAKIARFGEDDTMAMFETDEWGDLVEMRGPCEGIAPVRCDGCGHEYPLFWMNEFMDAEGWVCRKCGNVYFKSTYDDQAPPLCPCGGRYVNGCPECEEEKYTILKGRRSRYEYFATHQFIRGKDV